MNHTRLQAVDPNEVPTLLGTTEPVPPPAPPQRSQAALTGLLITALRALSQRTIIALNALGDLLLIASAFALWLMVIVNPTVLQLVGLGVYAAFILAVVVLRRRQ